jgi:hypothetical protein
VRFFRAERGKIAHHQKSSTALPKAKNADRVGSVNEEYAMAQTRILLIGIDPTLVEFSPSSGRNAEQVRAAGGAANERLSALGYTVQNCLVDLGATAEATVLKALAEHLFDVILIGAGIRALPQHTLLFERIINAVHQNAPSAKLCFNTNPNDTAEAVQRWI